MTSIVKINLQVLNSGVNQSVNELEEGGARDDGDRPGHFKRSLVAAQGRADFAPTQKGK